MPREPLRIALYLLLLAVIGPLTFINYLVSDQWLNLWIQSIFNLFVAFVGYVLVLRIRQFQASSHDSKALQSFSILFIASLLVALPLFYTAIFLSFALHLVNHRQIESLSEKIPLVIAGLVGVLSVLLNNLDSLRKSRKNMIIRTASYPPFRQFSGP